MLTATVLAGVLATAVQTKEELVAEILAAHRATQERGSYAMHMEQDTTQNFGGMQAQSRSEGDGTAQPPNLSRVRMRTTTTMGGNSQPAQETEMFTAGTRIWQRGPGGWSAVQIPPGMSGVQDMMQDPMRFTQRMLQRADEVTLADAEEIEGVRCRAYRVVLGGAAVAALMGEMLAQAPVPMRVEAEGSSMTMTIYAGEEDRLLRRTASEMRMRMSMGTGQGGQPGMAGSIETSTTQTVTLSRHGEAPVEIPEELADQVRGDRN